MEDWNPPKEAFENQCFNPNLGRSGQTQNDVKNQLFVQGIPPELGDVGLRNLFEKYGKVLYVKLLPHNNPEFRTRAGFIHYGTFHEAQAAIRGLDGTKLGGCCLRVTVARPRKSKSKFEEYVETVEKGPLIEKDVEGLMKRADKQYAERSPSSRANSSPRTAANQTFNSFVPTDGHSSKNYMSPDEKSSTSFHQTSQNPRSQNSNVAVKISPRSDDGERNASFRAENFSLHQTRSPQENGSVSASGKPEKGIKKPCNVCGVLAAKYCSNCCSVYYCSEKCQKGDWKEHRLECKSLAEQRLDEEDTDEPLVCVEEALCRDVARMMEGMARRTGSVSKGNNAVSKKQFPPQIASFTSQLKGGSVLDLEVIDIDSSSAWIVCQAADSKSLENLNKLQNELNAFFNSKKGQLHSSPAIGDACAAIFSDDGSWYRSKISEFSDDNQQVVVQFVDYGNSELIDCNKLMRLDERFCTLPAYSMPCKLAGLDMDESWTDKQTSFLVGLLQENGMQLKGKCNKIVEDTIIGEFMCGDVSVNEKMKRLVPMKSPKNRDVNGPPTLKTPPEKTAFLNDHTDHAPKKSVAKKLFRSVQIPREKFKVFVSFVESPDSFYCQVVADDFVEMHNYMPQLTEHFSTKKVQNYTPAVGDVCAAVFDEDQQWYRGKVLEAPSTNFFKVFYVDFGNVAGVMKSNIQPLPQRFQDLPFQAFKATLADCYPVQNAWSEKSIHWFKKCENSSIDAVKHSDRGDGLVALTLYMTENKTVTDHLVSMGFASKTQATRCNLPPLAKTQEKLPAEVTACIALKSFIPPCKMKVNVIISSVSYPGYFYCYVDNDPAEQVKSRSDQLNDYCSDSKPPPRNMIKEGLYCLAYFEKRQSWCRAIVMNNKESLIHVRSVDYGQAVWVLAQELRMLPQEFSKPPSLALHCRLADVRPLSGVWDEEFTSTMFSYVNSEPMEAFFVAKEEKAYVVKLPVIINTLIRQKCVDYCIY